MQTESQSNQRYDNHFSPHFELLLQRWRARLELLPQPFSSVRLADNCNSLRFAELRHLGNPGILIVLQFYWLISKIFGNKNARRVTITFRPSLWSERGNPGCAVALPAEPFLSSRELRFESPGSLMRRVEPGDLLLQRSQSLQGGADCGRPLFLCLFGVPQRLLGDVADFLKQLADLNL